MFCVPETLKMIKKNISDNIVLFSQKILRQNRPVVSRPWWCGQTSCGDIPSCGCSTPSPGSTCSRRPRTRTAHTEAHDVTPVMLSHFIHSIPYIYTYNSQPHIHSSTTVLSFVCSQSFIHNHSITFLHSFIQGIRARNNLQLLPVLCRFLFEVLPLVALAHTKVTALSDRVGVGIRTV